MAALCCCRRCFDRLCSVRVMSQALRRHRNATCRSSSSSSIVASSAVASSCCSIVFSVTTLSSSFSFSLMLSLSVSLSLSYSVHRRNLVSFFCPFSPRHSFSLSFLSVAVLAAAWPPSRRLFVVCGNAKCASQLRCQSIHNYTSSWRLHTNRVSRTVFLSFQTCTHSRRLS